MSGERLHDHWSSCNSSCCMAFCFSFEVLIYLVQKETQCFYLQFLGLKVIDFKNCSNSAVLPSNKDLNCIVSS